MIYFSKITKTLDGYDCHYFGTRISNGIKLHCFGVWTTTGLYEKCYDENGKHLVWSDLVGKWSVSDQPDFQIIAPPKIVEVTRWITINRSSVDGDFFLEIAGCRDHLTQTWSEPQQHTFRFEVPNV